MRKIVNHTLCFKDSYAIYLFTYQFPEGPALLVPQAEVNLALAAIGKGARIAPLDKGAVTWQRL